MERIFKGTDRKKADLILVILASQSIGAEIKKNTDNTWEIRVSGSDHARARIQISRYGKENRALLRQIRQKGIEQTRPGYFFSPAVLVIMGILALTHILVHQTLEVRETVIFQFGVSAYFTGQGEAFRAITALFLHSDLRHLLGNLAGLFVFAGPLARVTGPGSASLLLLAAGAAGNLLACGFGETPRLSIGASTAVMGAAGLLGARKRIQDQKGLVSIAAAATLMALFSHGENTDVAAHFFGFGAGIGIGMLFFPFEKILAGIRMELICLGLCLAIVLSALFQGLFLF